MKPKSIVLKAALIGAALALLQSTPTLAGDPATSAEEAPINVVGVDEGINETGDMNHVDDLAKNDVNDGAMNEDATDSNDGAMNEDATDSNDGAHDAVDNGKENATESVQDQHEQTHDEQGPNGP